MAKQIVTKGDTSRIEYVFIQDSSVTTGAGKTGLVFNTANLTAYYVRTQGAATAITLATQTVTGAYSSGGFVEIDATNMPGVYRFDPPDACFATGADKVVIKIRGAANAAGVALEYQLVNIDLEDVVRLGLTALPNVASGSAGAIPTTGTGANQIAVSSGLVALTTVEEAAIADKVLGRNIAGGSDGGRTVTQSFRVLRNKATLAAGTLTVYREDDTTSDWTAAVATTAGDPISSIDPA